MTLAIETDISMPVIQCKMPVAVAAGADGKNTTPQYDDDYL